MKATALGWLGLLLVTVSVTITACQGGRALYQGKQVVQERRVVLAPDSATGVWETFDVVVRYAYSLDAGRMSLVGSVTVSEHYQLTYEILEKLELDLVLLDREARVVASRELDIGRPLGQLWQMEFDEQFALPDGVESFSFAYDGKVRGGGHDRPESASFWLVPH